MDAESLQIQTACVPTFILQDPQLRFGKLMYTYTSKKKTHWPQIYIYICWPLSFIRRQSGVTTNGTVSSLTWILLRGPCPLPLLENAQMNNVVWYPIFRVPSVLSHGKIRFCEFSFVRNICQCTWLFRGLMLATMCNVYKQHHNNLMIVIYSSDHTKQLYHS